PTLGSWQNWLDSQLAGDMTRLGDLFSTRDWYNLVPDQNHTLVTAGYGTYGDSDYVTAAATADGTLAMAYCPGSATLTVDMSQFSGPVVARWFDPTNGTYTTVSGSMFANSGSVDFSTPGTNSNGDSDWVLVLDTVTAAAAGDVGATEGNSTGSVVLATF